MLVAREHQCLLHERVGVRVPARLHPARVQLRDQMRQCSSLVACEVSREEVVHERLDGREVRLRLRRLLQTKLLLLLTARAVQTSALTLLVTDDEPPWL